MVAQIWGPDVTVSAAVISTQFYAPLILEYIMIGFRTVFLILRASAAIALII